MPKLLPSFTLLLALVQPAYALTGLNADQTRVLASLHVPIALPANVPAGFRVEDVVTHVGSGGPGGGSSYAVLYAGPNDTGFAIESSSGGIGDLPGTAKADVAMLKMPGHTKTSLFFDHYGSTQSKSWLSGWVDGHNQFYRLAGCGYARAMISADFMPRQEISLAQAKAVLGSLRIVTP